MIHNLTVNDYGKICCSYDCSSCIIYIEFFAIFFIISISISSAFIYFNWYLKRKCVETTIY